MTTMPHHILPGTIPHQHLHTQGLRWADRYARHISSQPPPGHWYLPLWVDPHYPPAPDSPIVQDACHESTAPDGTRLLWHALPYTPAPYVALRVIQHLQTGYLAPAIDCLTPTTDAPADTVPVVSAVAREAWDYLHPRYCMYAPIATDAGGTEDTADDDTPAPALTLDQMTPAERVEFLEATLTLERLTLKNKSTTEETPDPAPSGEIDVQNTQLTAGIARVSERPGCQVDAVRNALRSRGLAYGGGAPDSGPAELVDTLGLPDG